MPRRARREAFSEAGGAARRSTVRVLSPGQLVASRTGLDATITVTCTNFRGFNDFRRDDETFGAI